MTKKKQKRIEKRFTLDQAIEELSTDNQSIHNFTRMGYIRPVDQRVFDAVSATAERYGMQGIEKLLKDWNQKNDEQLREVIITGQLRYHKQQKKKILPPNCENKMYYKDLQVCTPDNVCQRIKNPVNYTKRKAFILSKQGEPGKGGRAKLTEEQKEMRKKFREMKKKEDEKK